MNSNEQIKIGSKVIFKDIDERFIFGMVVETIKIPNQLRLYLVNDESDTGYYKEAHEMRLFKIDINEMVSL